MILDSFKLHTAIFQLRYIEAYELWDRAGAISRAMCAIWPDLKLSEGKPQRQILEGNGVHLQTEIAQSTVTLKGDKSLEQHKVKQLIATFDVWRKELALKELKRISTRTIFVKDFSSTKEANAELRSLGLVRWPSSKVFDQPLESDLNGFEIRYRFEDKSSFSFLSFRVEQVKYDVELDPDFFDETEMHRSKYRMIIDFDRGLLGVVDAEKFRVDDWIKGHQHILRRDIEKVTKG